MKTNKFSVLLQSFFTDYLVTQRQASQHTIASYRDTFKLLLQFIHNNLKKEPSAVKIEEITTQLIQSILKDLEQTRNVSSRTRNQRLSAIHACYRYACHRSEQLCTYFHPLRWHHNERQLRVWCSGQSWIE